MKYEYTLEKRAKMGRGGMAPKIAQLRLLDTSLGVRWQAVMR